MYSHSKKITVPEDVFTESFAMQYITLILFILIFSIAAFLPKNKIEKSAPPQQISQEYIRIRDVPEVVTSSVLSWSYGKGLHAEALEPYITLARNHDLHLKITLFRNKHYAEAAYHTAQALASHLQEQGLPSKAFMIDAVYREGGISTFEVAVLKGAEGWR